jgi:hypothetical protein
MEDITNIMEDITNIMEDIINIMEDIKGDTDYIIYKVVH